MAVAGALTAPPEGRPDHPGRYGHNRREQKSRQWTAEPQEAGEKSFVKETAERQAGNDEKDGR